MKKFTCLLIALLAISAVRSAEGDKCPGDATAAEASSALQALKGYEAAIIQTGTSAIASDAGFCNYATAKMCCKATEFKSAVSTELTNIKNAFVNIGTKVKDFVAVWTKAQTLLTDANIDTLTTDAERAGATAAQLKAWRAQTQASITTDFDAFKGQAATCFATYAKAARIAACEACAGMDTWAAGDFANTYIQIATATCSTLVTDCGKVWNFAHKFGWLVQTAAAINKKKQATATSTIPANINAVYAPGNTNAAGETALTLTQIDEAVGKCGPSVGTTCDDAAKAIMCRAFFSIWSDKAGATPRIGRGSTTDFAAASVSSVTRRVLVAAHTGAIKVASTGLVLTTDRPVTLTTAVDLTTTDTGAWTVGSFPSSSSSSSSSTSSSKSAKVLIGSILSILAVALLN